MKVEVHLLGGLRKIIDIDPYATRGAVVGKNLFFDDGTIVTRADFGGGSAPDDGTVITSWELILNIPPNVVALAEATGTGLFAVTGASTGAMRTLADSATIEWANGDGVAGNPVASLKELPDTGIGIAPVKIYARDAYGRIEGDEDADTDDLPEGATNLYFTLARVFAGFNLDPGSEPEYVIDLNVLEGTLFFKFDQDTIGGISVSPGVVYDAVGLQIGSPGQRTQIACTSSRKLHTRSNDAGAWSSWYDFVIYNPSGNSDSGAGEILVADDMSGPPVMLTDEAETDFVYGE